MNIPLTVEQSNLLARLALQAGRNVDELAKEAVSRLLDDESRYIEGVLEAEAAIDGGEHLTSEAMRAHFAHLLTP